VLEAGGVDVIMLDNMSVSEMKEAIQLIGGKCKTEASGNITEETIGNVAKCGVDYISVGALNPFRQEFGFELESVLKDRIELND
jgi:nicotinate-nucleotide pyrophosphorylase (carboxylating)